MNRKRCTIGMLIDWVVNPYQELIFRGVKDFAETNDVNLICFEGGSIKSPRPYEAHRNILYKMVSKERLDGLIILAATISRFVSYPEMKVFCDQFKPLPIVSLSYLMEGIHSIILDNQAGMSRLMEHLIEQHEFRSFGFIKGTEGNQDSDERYDVFLKSLSRFNIPLDQSLVFSGDFTIHSGIQAISKIVDNKLPLPEVLVAANDNMAIGVIEECNSRGIQIPEKLAVTGFDNIYLARYCSSPLTTVIQPIYEQGKMAGETLLRIINGQEVPLKQYLPTKVIIRHSCGDLFSHTHEHRFKNQLHEQEKNVLPYFLESMIPSIKRVLEELKSDVVLLDAELILKGIIEDFFNALYEKNDFIHLFHSTLFEISSCGGDVYILQEFIADLKTQSLLLFTEAAIVEKINDFCFKALFLIGEHAMAYEKHKQNDLIVESQALNMLREEFHVTVDIVKQNNALETWLPKLGIKCFFLSIFNRNSKGKKAILLHAYSTEEPLDNKVTTPFLSKELIPWPDFPLNRRFTFFVESLKEFGFILFEVGEEEGRVYSLLRDIISSALQGALLYKQVQDQRNDLALHLAKLRKSMGGFVQTMARTVETRDPYTAGHQRRVSELARNIAQELNLDPDKIEAIRMAGIIHDLGKIYVPAEILNRPGRLDAIEFSLIKRHPEVAYNILKNIEFPWPLADIVYQHHERLDGSGYPNGLRGDEINIEARILTVSDVVEAMASHRPYRESLGIDAALSEIDKYKNIYYDPAVVDACIRLFRKKGFTF
ncbi:MAG: substrate-binding domain-containing protein [Spirochaetales bacterium]|nr:substrate-binding domain-containing protein [Spirochaetales bacterium]